MDVARAALANDGRVTGRDVAYVRDEPVVREDRVQPAHRAIAHDLRDDRGGCDRSTAFVPVHDGLVFRRVWTKPEPVDETRLRRRRERGERLPQATKIRPVQAVAVDRRRRDDPHADALGAARERSEESLTVLVRDL